MVKGFLIGAALTLIGTCASAASGAELLQRCAEAVKSLDATTPQTETRKVSSDVSLCVGFVEGVVGAATLYTVGAGQGTLPEVLRICVPTTTSTEQVIRAIVRFLETRPRLLEETWAPALAVAALRDAYPCK